MVLKDLWHKIIYLSVNVYMVVFHSHNAPAAVCIWLPSFLFVLRYLTEQHLPEWSRILKTLQICFFFINRTSLVWVYTHGFEWPSPASSLKCIIFSWILRFELITCYCLEPVGALGISHQSERGGQQREKVINHTQTSKHVWVNTWVLLGGPCGRSVPTPLFSSSVLIGKHTPPVLDVVPPLWARPEIPLQDG